MGNDGGSIPTRRELVKEAAKNPNVTELKEKQKEHLAHRWSQCPISHKALTPPIVADYSGDLYNKDAIIQYLLPAEVSPLDKIEAEGFIAGRVKGLKDVVEVKFEIERDEILKTERWVCPVTGKELGVHVRAVFIVPCGHAFSQEAVREMKSDDACSVCAAAYMERDVVPILPTSDADRNYVVERMEKLREVGLTHSLKRAKGEKKKRHANGEVKTAEGATASAPRVSNGAEKTQSTTTTTSVPKPRSNVNININHGATASLTAKVLAEEEAKRKKRRLEKVGGGGDNNNNDNIESLYTKKGGNQKARDGDFMTRGFSIPANGTR